MSQFSDRICQVKLRGYVLRTDLVPVFDTPLRSPRVHIALVDAFVVVHGQ